jgi:hypothetical protein
MRLWKTISEQSARERKIRMLKGTRATGGKKPSGMKGMPYQAEVKIGSLNLVNPSVDSEPLTICPCYEAP